MKLSKNLAKWLALCFVIAALFAPPRAHAHDGEDHGAAPTPAAVSSGATQTELEIHLEDLSQGAAGTSAPLVGAKVRGFLKHDDGDLLSRVTATPARNPGFYLVHFAEDASVYRFSEPGIYLLELHVTPQSGEAFDTTVTFALPAAVADVPLWRRVLPWITGALILALLAWFVIKKRKSRSRSGNGDGDDTDANGESGAIAIAKTDKAETVVAALLCVALLGSGARAVWAHGGEDDEKPAPVAATTAATSNIQLGETSATTKAGNVRVTLIARTAAAAPDILAPGEVQLPAETARLLDIATAPVAVAQLPTGVDFNGQIAPTQGALVRVSTLVPGRVTRLSVEQGDKVSRGQIVAVVESRAIGEAQSAFAQAQARLANAQSNLKVIRAQADAGVFSRAPLEAARREQAQSAGDVRQGQAALQSARVALDTATRTARAGGYANPALEAARAQSAGATQALKTAQAALDNATSSVQSAGAELARRQQLARSGAYVSRPVQEARRALVAAQSARAAAGSEVATTRANLSRAQALIVEGLVSGRDLEAARQAFETATARLETAQADAKAAQQEVTRQGQISASNVNGAAEVAAAQSALTGAQADAATRRAEVARAQSGVKLAGSALQREQKIFGAGIANRSQLGNARAEVQSAQAGLYKAQRALEVANSTLARERKIADAGLNNTAQIQAARAGLVSAQADADAARGALKLLQSSPGSSVDVPVRAPIAGVVSSRDVAPGELVQADAPLMTVVNLDSVALEASLFEADAARVNIGDAVTLSSDAAPGRRFSGRISYIGSQVDPQTRALTARATLDNPGALRPGVFVRGQIQTGVGAPSLTVPEGAILEDGAAKIVFVVKGDRYQRRAVVTGATSQGRTEVKSGIGQSDVVVTEGAAALRAQAARGN